MASNPPYVHQQNGLVERSIQYINNQARTVMTHNHAPMHYWECAFDYVVDTYNVTPNAMIGMITPYQAMHGIVPDVSHMVPFYSHGVRYDEMQKNKLSPAALRAACSATPKE